MKIRKLLYFCNQISISKNNIMARPIRNTPILVGKDAVWFEQQMKNLPSADERAKARRDMEESAKRLETFLRSINAV